VKVRDLAHLLGWRPAPRTYGVDIRTFDLPVDGAIQYAQWLHPGETPKVIRQEVVDELRRYIRPGDVAIDVGAHTGDSTIPMALAAGPSGRVLALEPNPYVFVVLDRNAGLNAGKTSIVPMNLAATAESGPIEFEYSDAGFCNGGRHAGISRWRHGHAFRLTVQGIDLQAYLDAYLPDLVPKLRFIKIDAEGYDLTVLEALAGLVDRTRPFVRAEVFKLTTAAQRERLHGFFTSRQYDVFRVAGESDYRGEPLAAADMTRWPHFDVFGVPRPAAAG
jgi:FkbM family methyltransferase